MTLRAGIHDQVPAGDYHRDPAPEPSLSAGTANRLLTRSPLHAWTEHPRLNPDVKKQESDQLDFGTAAHSLLLEGLDVCHIVEHDSWRTNAAKAARDEARRDGLVPLLRHDYDRMSELCQAVKRQLAHLDVNPRPLSDGKPEQTIVWQEQGVWCRCRIDWLHQGLEHADDLKTTATSANPHLWARNRLFADGKDVQCAFYLRGLRAVTGEHASWRFVVVETVPPYAVSVISLAPAALELAERKVDRALELWKRCLEADEWPGYPREVAFAEPPAWEEARFLEAHWETEEVAA